MKNVLNAAALFAANATTAASQYLVVVLVARRLGPESFGTFIFGLTFGGVVATLCNFGLDRVIIRAMIRNFEQRSIYFWSGAALRVVLGILTLLAAQALLVSFGYAGEPRVTILLIVASLVVALLTELCRSALYASTAMFDEAMLRAIGRILTLAVVGLVLWGGGGILQVSAALVVAAVFELAVYGIATVIRTAISWQPPSLALARDLAIRSAPLAVTTFLVLLYFRFSIIMLTSWGGSEAAGLFGAAFTFLQAMQVASASLAGVILPSLARRQLQAPAVLREPVRTVTYFLLLGVVPVAVLLSMMADDVMTLVYGSRYIAAAPALRVLAWASIFMFVGSLYGTLLVVLDRERSLVWVSAMATVVSLAANRVLIPELGLVGASWATVATEGTVAVTTMALVWRTLGGVGANVFTKPIAVGITLALTLTAVRGFDFPVRAAMAALSLGLSLLLLKAIPPEALRIVGNAIRSVRGARA
jgi:O-antigen/teichoic acid export membrane protein